MRMPPVTVRCECGAVRALRYGERWTCETCGRTWDTSQIPAEEYRALEDALRRYRLEALGFAALMLAIFVPLMVIVDIRLGITGLIVFFAWSFLFRPRQRRRLLERVRSGSRWQLRPE